jgi:hypothetical protein
MGRKLTPHLHDEIESVAPPRMGESGGTMQDSNVATGLQRAGNAGCLDTSRSVLAVPTRGGSILGSLMARFAPDRWRNSGVTGVLPCTDLSVPGQTTILP